MGQYNGEKFQHHMKTRWMGRGCPMCGHSEWIVANTTFQLSVLDDGTLEPRQARGVMAFIPVTCGHCGTIMLVSALQSGAIEPGI